MKSVFYLGLLGTLAIGCDSLRGPNQSYIAPAVQGRVLDAPSGRPLPDARVQRYLYRPTASDPLARKGAEQLRTVPTVRSDVDGRFQIAPERGGYLLFERPGVLEFTLVIRHPTHETLITNVDLLEIKPKKTNNVLTAFVGDLSLDPKAP